MSYAYVPDPFVWMDPLGLIQIGRLGSAIAEAFAGPAVGGIEHAPLHAHLKDGASKTRVLMEDYYKKGKLVGIKGQVYPGDPPMTKNMKKLVEKNLDDLAAKTKSVFETGSC